MLIHLKTKTQVRMEFPNVLAQQNAHGEYVHLLESISAVLGATRQPKADLLEEPTSSGGISHSVSGHVQVCVRVCVIFVASTALTG